MVLEGRGGGGRLVVFPDEIHCSAPVFLVVRGGGLVTSCAIPSEHLPHCLNSCAVPRFPRLLCFSWVSGQDGGGGGEVAPSSTVSRFWRHVRSKAFLPCRPRFLGRVLHLPHCSSADDAMFDYQLTWAALALSISETCKMTYALHDSSASAGDVSCRG